MDLRKIAAAAALLVTVGSVVMPRRSILEIQAAAMRDTLDGAMGRPARRPPSPYERHRDEYVRTGDPRALRQMLRHVSA